MTELRSAASCSRTTHRGRPEDGRRRSPTRGRRCGRLVHRQRGQHVNLVPAGYDPSYGPEDRASTVLAFRELARFYAELAEASRAVIFTVDQ